jgi:hypothetical protein
MSSWLRHVAAFFCLIQLAGCLPALEWPQLGAARSDALAASGGGSDPFWPSPSTGIGDVSRGADGGVGEGASMRGCRAFLTGELIINEVVVRPSGLDLDGDGTSSGRDELVELVSIADEPAFVDHLGLLFDGSERGVAASDTCVPPGHALILVGSTTGPFSAPAASSVLVLSRTLRLTDGGGSVAVVAKTGEAHDVVVLPAAPAKGPHVMARRADADWSSPWAPHQQLSVGLLWSPGRCVDGGLFPACATGPPALQGR